MKTMNIVALVATVLGRHPKPASRGALVVLSVFYFAMVATSRNYRAHQHNWTVNKHRQNASSTFETFVKATTDDQTKNAVLLYAAQAIFARGRAKGQW
jgi:hypothetical protein